MARCAPLFNDLLAVHFQDLLPLSKSLGSSHHLPFRFDILLCNVSESGFVMSKSTSSGSKVLASVICVTSSAILLGIHSAEHTTEEEPLGLNVVWYGELLMEIIEKGTLHDTSKRLTVK